MDEFNTKRTAVNRRGPSLPLRAVLEAGLIGHKQDVLDFGCGHGADVSYFGRGYPMAYHHGFDPNFPTWSYEDTLLKHGYDVVLMTYVVNVLPPRQAYAVVQKAWSYVKPGGRLIVTTRTEQEIDARARKAGWTFAPPPRPPGWITKAGTYQQGYEAGQLKALLAGACIGHLFVTELRFKGGRSKYNFTTCMARKR